MQNSSHSIHRGQLQIAETLVSVALMLVLAILLIAATSRTISPHSNQTSLDQTATDILITADETGLLRPVIYLHSDSRYEAEYSSYKNLLDEYISAIVSDSIDYVIIAHEIRNGTIDNEYFSPIGSPNAITSLQQIGEGVIANYHLGSFTSAAFGQYYAQYFVQLYLWEKSR